MPAPKDPEKYKLWIERMSKAKIGEKNSNFGKHISQKQKDSISKANKGKHANLEGEFKKGKHASPETEFKKGEYAYPEAGFKKGHIQIFTWKGQKLTKKHRKKLSLAHIGKPGYWKGKHLYKEVVEGLRKRALKQMKNGGMFGRGKAGRRKDLNNTFFRSRWEANYARYLNFLKIKWEFEPKTFWFKKIKRGTMTYTPDFYLPIEDKFIEIKGWFDDKSKTKIKRFKKYYPREFKRLVFVIRDPWSEGKADIDKMRFLERLEVPLDRIESYKEIEDKLGGLILNWE